LNERLILHVLSKKIILIVFALSGNFALLAQDPAPVKKPQDVKVKERKPIPVDQKTGQTQPQTEQKKTQQQGRQGKGSQIVDDSTKNVYGPKTTLWISENDLFLNRKNYQPLDTTLNNYHRWTYVQRFNNHYQDLGNVGTALNPIFPSASEVIGATPGYSVYNPYYDTEAPVYFDTKSPYSSFRLVWGGDGRAISKIEFSRNINPRWNFGFNYRPLLADKQIQRQGKGDRQTISHYYDLYSSYKSKNDRYMLLFNFRRLRHRVNENGGILLQDQDTTENAYYDPNAAPYLLEAQTEEKKITLHVFQQFQLASPFQLYHRLDITKQNNLFTDNKNSETNYDKYFSFTNTDPDIDTVNVSDGIEFKTMVNEVGIKGNAAFLFYNFYYKVRTFSTYNRYVDETLLSFKNDGVESYVGGKIAFQFDSLSELSGNAEYLLDGNYRLQAELKTPWLDAKGMSVLAKPGFLPLAYRGSHNSWVNDFSNTFSNQLEGFLKVKWGGLFISPGARYVVLNNYIYYKENTVAGEQSVLPAQSSGNQQVFSPELRMSLRFFKNFYLRPQVIYSSILKNDDQALRMPEWFANAQLAYENILFKGNMQVQIGFDFHWRSSYTALGYDPAIQQYYVQNSFVNQAFPLTDVFFNGKFKRGRFFFKYHNLVQAATGKGYIITPEYRGQPNIMDFGFDLILFD
jgi:Putative porin